MFKHIVALLLLALALPALAQQPAPVFTLLSNSLATGSRIAWPGGTGVLIVSGTWGGATATLQFVGPDGALVSAGASTTLTANGAGVFYLPRCSIQVTITSATGATALYATASVIQTSVQ